MSRQGEKQQASAGADLLNFHFSTSPRQQQQHSFGGRRSRSQQQYRRTKEDRASARRKASSKMFYLHSSPDHAFIISRRPIKQQSCSFQGSDEPVSWESVRIVKYLSTAHQQESCPICLDTFRCPRITKCGHVFCLACVIRHAHSFAANNPYADGPKCPCCAIPLHLSDLRPVELVTVVPPVVNHRIKLVKLHRTKGCPSPFLPLPDQPKRSSPRAAPCQTDVDAMYCRFNYVDPVIYQALLSGNLHELEQLDISEDTEAVCQGIAMDMVKREIQAAMAEADEEVQLMERFASPNAGIYQPQPKQLMASNYKVVPPTEGASHPSNDEAIFPLEGAGSHDAWDVGEQEAPIEHVPHSQGSSRRYRGDSMESEHSIPSLQGYMRGRGDSITSHDTDPSVPRRKCGYSKINLAASMFLDATDEFAFYQAEDGMLCFLSKFNMSCLRSDFSPSIPDESLMLSESAQFQPHKVSPLPDYVEGRILDIERVHLTEDVRQRLRFLSHIPLYSDICFVELSLGSILSSETKKTFRKDFQKRKQAREKRQHAEQRADERARREEEERIKELKARYQSIDPNDDFFYPVQEMEAISMTGDDFGPTISAPRPDGSLQQADPVLSFSSVTRSGGAFPALGSDETNFPALGSSPTRRSTQPSSWGPVTSSPRPSQEPLHGMSSPTDVKKKSKGKKIVLFSTGSHRGGAH